MKLYPGNVGVAFAVSIGAGLATSIGAALPFYRRIKATDGGLLALALSSSAGLMLFVSMCEILQQKALAEFLIYYGPGCSIGETLNGCDAPNSKALAAAYGCFFVGGLIFLGLDYLSHKLVAGHDFTDDILDEIVSQQNHELSRNGQDPCAPCIADTRLKKSSIELVELNGCCDPNTCCQNDAITSSSDSASENTALKDNSASDGSGSASSDKETQQDGTDGVKVDEGQGNVERNVALDVRSSDDNLSVEVQPRASQEDVQLQKMGLLAGLAIALHNVPEGLATFALTLKDPAVGLPLAIAIAIHNIPEGVTVAMPIYYATRSRWKGFVWGTLAGFAEILGGVLGYIIIVSGGDSEGLTLGILFSVVAGMMVFIVVFELLPTAFRYDSQHEMAKARARRVECCVTAGKPGECVQEISHSSGKRVMTGFTVGMFTMALSLVLFVA